MPRSLWRSFRGCCASCMCKTWQAKPVTHLDIPNHKVPPAGLAERRAPEPVLPCLGVLENRVRPLRGGCQDGEPYIKPENLYSTAGTIQQTLMGGYVV